MNFIVSVTKTFDMKLWLIIIATASYVSPFSAIETSVLTNLLEYFEADYLELLDESLEHEVPTYISNSSFPARNMVLTTVLTPQQMIERLVRDKKRPIGISVVAARLNSPSWSQFVQLVGLHSLSAVKWILFTLTPSNTVDLRGLYIPFDCQFLVVNMNGSLPIMTEVYHMAQGEQLHTSHFGYWDPERGLSPPHKEFYLRRPNLKGHTFTVIIQDMSPYTYIKRRENGSLVMKGYFYEVWKELEVRLKFRTKFEVIANGEKPLPYLLSKRASFLISPCVQNAISAEDVDFTQPIYEAKILLFGNRPGTELEWNSYLKPFSRETWLVTLGWMLISAVALSGLYFVAWRERASEPESGYYIFTPTVSFETVFRAICGQGSDVTPRSMSCRLLFLSIYSTALVLTSAFSAALFSLLTIPVSRAPFNTFKDVLSNKAYKLGIIPSSDIHEGIKALADRFPNSDHDNLFRMLEPSQKLPNRVKDALQRVCDDKEFVFMWDMPNVLEIMQNLTRECQEKIMPGGPIVFREHLGFATHQGNPFRSFFNLHLLRLKNEGVLHRLLLSTWPPPIPNVPSSWVRVTLADISPILFMFAAGTILGVILMLLEHLHLRLRKKSRTSRHESSTHLHSATQQSHNLKHNFDITSPTTPPDPFATKYTDWTENQANLHRRIADKAHYQ